MEETAQRLALGVFRSRRCRRSRRFLERENQSRRDDRWMLTIAEPCARPKVECFDRPLRDGHVFVLDSPALRSGLVRRGGAYHRR
jgi:hypothetical protein